MTAGALVAVALAIQACGSSDVEDVAPGPTIAHVRFDGTFEVDELVVDGEGQPIAGPLSFDIDTEFGALGITTPCGTLLGSYSFFEDGRGGVTISGGSRTDCSAEAERQREELLDLLAEVSQWSETGSGFELRSPQGDSLTLVD